jgi:uncharacterized protein YcbX
MPVLSALTLYPIKSCAGIGLQEATLTSAGLMSRHIYDREWMLVDADGEALTQREFPKMALIVPRLKGEVLEVRAPGMLPLEIPLDLPHPDDARLLRVRVGEDEVEAYDCDQTSAAWFSNAVGTPCRLARFHPDAERLSNMKWTGGAKVPNFFSDGFPMLVIGTGSLQDLNEKLVAHGRTALPMNRFRPNIVFDDIAAFEEEYAERYRIGEAVLKPVKPCPRCPMPSIDQATGEFGPDPLDILQTYRANERVGGRVSFGINTILLQGEGQVLRIGQPVEVVLAF